MDTNSVLEAAVEYVGMGFSVIPVGRDKVPLIDWKKYQTERATTEQVQQWFAQFPNANVGVVTGAISEIVVVDIEAGGDTKLFTPTVMSKTGGGGWHLFYKHPGTPVKNSVKDLAPLTDVRGDGGYIVMPPSLHASGKRYEWAIAPGDADYIELPSWIMEKTSSNEKQMVDWKAFVEEENLEGARNMDATKLSGKLLHDLSPELWEVSGWPMLKEWNRTQNKPPLEERELRQTWESIKTREKSQRTEADKDQGQRKTQSNALLEQLEENSNVVLFHDELHDPYVGLMMSGHQEIWRVRSKQFKRWLAKSFWDKNKKAANSDALNTALNIIEGKACFDGKEYILANRTIWREGALWYDLSDNQWRAVRVTAQGWSIVDAPPILFRRYAHQRPQVEPVTGGDIAKVLEFVNVSGDSQKLLFLVYLVSCFIPDFPHPILAVYGSQGSAKSSLSKFVRRLTDPSKIEVTEFPKTPVELIQKLSHHWCIFFDNVSYLPEYISDVLCRVVTGSGFSKRELYSDDEDVIYTLLRCIGINGINLVAEKPDLLERSILMELERVPQTARKQDKEMTEEFERERPKILGGIFDVLVRAIQIKDSIRLPSLPRMADFATWGCAITEAMGRPKEEFLDAYYANIKTQNNEVLHDSLVASALIAFMQDRTEWHGTPSELLVELKSTASTVQGVNTDKEKGFPKAANVLSKQLNRLKPNLAEDGIQLKHGEENHQRIIYIQKVEKSIVAIDGVSQKDDGTEFLGDDDAMQPLSEPSPENTRDSADRDDTNDINDSIQMMLES